MSAVARCLLEGGDGPPWPARILFLFLCFTLPSEPFDVLHGDAAIPNATSVDPDLGNALVLPLLDRRPRLARRGLRRRAS